MRSGGNNFNYFTENQLTNFSAVCEMFSLEFGHTLSVGRIIGTAMAVPATTALSLDLTIPTESVCFVTAAFRRPPAPMFGQWGPPGPPMPGSASE